VKAQVRSYICSSSQFLGVE